MSETIYEMLMRHEGVKGKPYRDTRGRLTIGVGRNLEDTGISESEAFNLLHADVHRARRGLDKYLPWWSAEPDPVRIVLQNMAFQLGVKGLLEFDQTLAALRRRDYPAAAKHMLDSLWAKQTPKRAQELAEIVAVQSIDADH
ncbi:MAG: glycoside hydrolase family protein [Gammaproteobacteria bacterium]